MGSLSRATNETTRGMRAFLLLLLVAATLSDALSTLNGRVDEEHNAIVVEALRARSGRAFSWFSGTPSSPFAGMFPAATQPLAPAAPGQQILCRTPSGALTFCQANYQWPGQYPGGAPGGFPGAPGGFPGAPGGFPGQGGGFPGAQPGWPQAPQQPQQPQWPPPVPTHPPQPAQPVQTPQPVQPVPTSPPVAPVVAETTTKAPVTNRPAGSSPGQCGVGRYHPIRYDSNGQVAEEVERANEAGAKIVNGWDADQGEWPWIAALMNNGRQFCGGSLITRKHILTAAHCVAHMSRYDVANLKVRLGEHAIKQTGETQLFEKGCQGCQTQGVQPADPAQGRCCDHPGDRGARSAQCETRVPRRVQRSRPGSADCHRGWMGKSEGERAAAKHPAGGDGAHLGQQGVQGHVRTRRPWRHHGPHALCWTEGEGLLQW